MAELKEHVRSVVSGQKQYPVKSKPLWVPGLEQLVPYVESALRENYSNVKVRREKAITCNVTGVCCSVLIGYYLMTHLLNTLYRSL